MAASTSSNFTSTDRRKKIVTYGKSSRLSTIPSPAPASNEDAPSPERPRKQPTATNKSLNKLGSTLKTSGSVVRARARTGDSDIFDVPSEDEASLSSRKPTKSIPASGKQAPATTAAPRVGKLQKPIKTSKPVSSSRSPSDFPIAPRVPRGKTPQLTQKQNTWNEELAQRPKAVAKPTSRATTPATSAPKVSRSVKAVSIPASRNVRSTRPAKAAETLDVFDVPSSDEETPLPVPKPVRQDLNNTAQKSAANIGSSVGVPHKDSAGSDDSSASKKRKRRGSISSISTVKPTIEGKRELSLPQRRRKYQKKEYSVSPGHKSLNEPGIPRTSEAESTAPAINKPRRTRTRTVPVFAPPKGQSSPAKLNSMLPGHQQPSTSSMKEVPEVTELKDTTMYEGLDQLATPARGRKNTASGSATPRQKALFSSLLGESSSSTTPIPKISALQLTDQKPNSLFGALSRSRSDLTDSAQARKTKLMGMIKRAQSSSDDDGEDADSVSESESDDEPEEQAVGRITGKETQNLHRPTNIIPENMDIDVEVAADSQTSQTTSSFGQRQRLTYAKSRSYLEEANPEDALLISMDLDDDVGCESQKKGNVSEEDEDPTSQVRARHELKRRGQQTAFHWETEMLIDEISIKKNNGVRRNTMMELCTQMVDATFTNNLVDSSLVHQFLRNITSNSEIIFDFATAVACILILKTNPTYTVLDQIQRTGIIANLVKLAGNATDIRTIAKDRKTNLSKITQESVGDFRRLVQESSIWTSGKLEIVSPQVVALKALELLIINLRTAGYTASLIDQDEVLKLVEIALHPAERLKSGKGRQQDILVLGLILSILEAVSVAKQGQPVWLTGTLQHLADLLPVTFQPDVACSSMLAMKLCMNLTNNKPKACQPFSGSNFVQPLVSCIIRKFGLLDTEMEQEQRIEVLETLILSLGAMINLAEFNDEARLNVDDGAQTISTLVKIFLDGSERAAQAESMEESHSGVAVGYLSVLLGNLCLNASIRKKVGRQLPHQKLDTLTDKIVEFIRVHEHAHSAAKQFEGEEGQETWQNYTARLMLVVEKLQNKSR